MRCLSSLQYMLGDCLFIDMNSEPGAGFKVGHRAARSLWSHSTRYSLVKIIPPVDTKKRLRIDMAHVSLPRTWGISFNHAVEMRGAPGCPCPVSGPVRRAGFAEGGL